jgi:hypothetical protein
MDVRPIDPPDTGWEVTWPSYRVYFWEAQPAPPEVSGQYVGHHSAEFELSGADIEDVLAWAKARASPGSMYTVYAVVAHADEKGSSVCPVLNRRRLSIGCRADAKAAELSGRAAWQQRREAAAEAPGSVASDAPRLRRRPFARRCRR